MKRTGRSRRFVESVGASIRSARQSAGLNQTEAGKRLDIDAPTMSRIESGKKDLRLSELFEVSRVLAVRPSDLVSVDGK